MKFKILKNHIEIDDSKIDTPKRFIVLGQINIENKDWILFLSKDRDRETLNLIRDIKTNHIEFLIDRQPYYKLTAISEDKEILENIIPHIFICKINDSIEYFFKR